MKTKRNKKIVTYSDKDKVNGFLIPVYNVNENFHEPAKEPMQVYVTVIYPGEMKGPHLHYIRTGFFTCIKGNIKIVTKVNGEYIEIYSGQDYDYLSVIIPTGTPALLINIGGEDAYVLNLPSPAWTPEMNDEYKDDFSDYFNNKK